MTFKMIPKLTVCVVTYNQGEYIRACLQSLVEQEVDFPFEILVSDDDSKDNTVEIIKEFAVKYPDIIRTIFHSTNIGAYANYQLVHSLAKGQYVAHMDGDDFAMPQKLQKQVELLDSHPSVALSAHAVELIGTKKIIGNGNNFPEFGTMNDLLLYGTYFVNSSTMYRRINGFPFKPGVNIIDFYCHIEHASKGLIHLNKEVLGGYRWCAAGISKRNEHRDRIEVAYILAFDRALELGAPSNIVMTGRLRQQMSFAIGRLLSGDVAGFRSRIKLSYADYLYASKSHCLLSVIRYFISWPILISIIRKYVNR